MSDLIIEGATKSSLDFKILSEIETAEIKASYAEIHELFLKKLAAEQALAKRLRELFGKKVGQNESISFAEQSPIGVLYRYEVYASKTIKSAHNSLADAVKDTI
jgi:alpha-ketoglutarate-dependent taurine dioxygenase